MSATKERPIICTGESVRGILAGRKTKTRRVAKFVARHGVNLGFSGLSAGHFNTGCPESGHVLYSRGRGGVWQQVTEPLRCPYGKAGDLLWVKETHAFVWPEAEPPERLQDCLVEYRADTNGKVLPADWSDADPEDAKENAPRWRSPLFMPRWASRITLEVTAVCVERVQGISELDAFSEGVETSADASARGNFAALWKSINGPESWQSNPWVWVVSFKRVRL